jgi:RNA polymerase sigma factor (sigma-70 family)
MVMPGGSDDDASERLTHLFQQHCASVRNFARRRVGPDDAQEIVAETFLVAWRRINDLSDPPLPWLYKVASFEIANHRRRNERHARVELALVEGLGQQQGGGDSGQSEDDANAVNAAFSALSPSDQEVLRLAAWERLSSAEGAIVIGCSVSAYKVRLHRARSRLARKAGVLGRRTFPGTASSRSLPGDSGTGHDDETEAIR